MAVGLSGEINPLPVAGVRIGSASLGIRDDPRDDLMVMEIAAGSGAAAVFTRNAFCAAPVIVAREHLAEQAPRYLLTNAGNANAGTGSAGIEDARSCCRALADCRDLVAAGGSVSSSSPISRGRRLR